MAWWTSPDIQLKQKNRFIMSIGEFLIPTVVSVDKPSVSIESKEYTMINHVYRYPGIAKWQPITVTFIDGSGNSKKDSGPQLGAGSGTSILRGIDSLDTAQQLFMILAKSGYKSGASVSGATSKTNMKNLSLLNSVRIEQIEPDGSTVSEGWRLHNPIFTDIKWGSLSYADDGAVEYSLTIAYDWAEYYTGHGASGGSLLTHSKLRESNAEIQDAVDAVSDSIKEMDNLLSPTNREATFRNALRSTQRFSQPVLGGGDIIDFSSPTDPDPFGPGAA